MDNHSGAAALHPLNKQFKETIRAASIPPAPLQPARRYEYLIQGKWVDGSMMPGKRQPCGLKP